MPIPFRRKPNRLPLAHYTHHAAYSVTIASAERQEVFADEALVQGCLAELRAASETEGFEVLAYCFMPDHVHLLLAAEEGGFLPDFVKRFKQTTGFAYKRRTGGALWQKSYFDHVLRREEEVIVVARYIFGNPVRAGLVAEAKDYPFSGSFAWGRDVLEA
ncbi:MAG: transposase [Dehalococcoidia bacterium]|nr:transposase [Dehalococcoidia bacterium]